MFSFLGFYLKVLRNFGLGVGAAEEKQGHAFRGGMMFGSSKSFGFESRYPVLFFCDLLLLPSDFFVENNYGIVEI